jgi:hypothetical protein
MTVTLAGHNLDFARPAAAAQQRDVAEMKAHADIVVTLEDVRGEGKGRRRERVIVHGPRVSVERSGRIRAALHRHGHAIGWRTFPWKDVELAGIGDVRVVGAHMPPLRMRGPLYWAYAWRLRRLLRRSGRPWLVFADWNWLIGNDPAGLTSRLGAKFYGRRIDGWAVHPALVRHVAGVRVVDPQRRDGHVVVYLTLKP